ncbi:HelD family protein [Paenibacillus flagellatus]|uniref:DNA helicase UvrD n=1 Tax=Paenibacillus flagellatus TaxID=2211139 RepID=A0A2V5K8V3_9BACL|nr:UvrD-helicase domain-containing protein [Paenibacillus flagellatus]PYI55828.1 DNA helicase UvrD [Paenibacillus flagellatus]
MEIQSAYQEELEKLESTSRWIDAKLESLRAIPRYFGEDLTEQVLDSIRENARRSLTAATDEPYFGRLDFREEGEAEARPLYIGKFGVDNDQSGEPLVIDWRAPIASLFYSFTGGEGPAGYESPDGLIEGLVYLKRNLVIRKQILQRVVDTYDRNGDNPAVTDEFLLYRLGENKDNKLRDIVSTIQAEQDQIIRSAKNTALVIQGVAGSGKTTVALHRLAYLLYQYREQIRAEKMIIFAPNRMFLDYISSVLPELGVGHIQQTTFEDWALETLPDRVELADDAERTSRWFAYGADKPVIDDDAPGRFKGSIRFMEALEAAMDAYERGFAPEGDFEPWPGAKLASAQIGEWFGREYRHYPVMKRKERVEARIKRWLEMQLNETRDPNVRKDRKKKASQKLKAYWKTWPDDTPLSFYRSLFAGPNDAAGSFGGLTVPAAIVEQTVRALKKNKLYPEDLAPLLFIYDRMYGIENERTFDHVVIDEAQDFSPFQVALLNRHVRNGSFTILGDLSQGIHPYKGIRRWDEFLGLFPDDARGYFTMERSYRSTMEIIRFANVVLRRGIPGAMQAVPVFRSGEKVKVVRHEPADRIGTIVRAVRKLSAGPASTIAVIGRTEKECKELHALLLHEDVSATLIDAGRNKYEGGLSVVPVYLAKGLEFDAVVLIDADAERYGADEHDAKLMYVGCTRALHDLWVLYAGEPTPLMEGADDDFAKRLDA